METIQNTTSTDSQNTDKSIVYSQIEKLHSKQWIYIILIMFLIFEFWISIFQFSNHNIEMWPWFWSVYPILSLITFLSCIVFLKKLNILEINRDWFNIEIERKKQKSVLKIYSMSLIIIILLFFIIDYWRFYQINDFFVTWFAFIIREILWISTFILGLFFFKAISKIDLLNARLDSIDISLINRKLKLTWVIALLNLLFVVIFQIYLWYLSSIIIQTYDIRIIDRVYLFWSHIWNSYVKLFYENGVLSYSFKTGILYMIISLLCILLMYTNIKLYIIKIYNNIIEESIVNLQKKMKISQYIFLLGIIPSVLISTYSRGMLQSLIIVIIIIIGLLFVNNFHKYDVSRYIQWWESLWFPVWVKYGFSMWVLSSIWLIATMLSYLPGFLEWFFYNILIISPCLLLYGIIQYFSSIDLHGKRIYAWNIFILLLLLIVIFLIGFGIYEFFSQFYSMSRAHL